MTSQLLAMLRLCLAEPRRRKALMAWDSQRRRVVFIGRPGAGKRKAGREGGGSRRWEPVQAGRDAVEAQGELGGVGGRESLAAVAKQKLWGQGHGGVPVDVLVVVDGDPGLEGRGARGEPCAGLEKARGQGVEIVVLIGHPHAAGVGGGAGDEAAQALGVGVEDLGELLEVVVEAVGGGDDKKWAQPEALGVAQGGDKVARLGESACGVGGAKHALEIEEDGNVGAWVHGGSLGRAEWRGWAG